MEDLILKKIILLNITNLIKNVNYNFSIDKKELVNKIFYNYNLQINNNNINIVDVFNNIDIEELSLGNTNYKNEKIDNLFSSSR